ncbi:Mechanosensitive ion channel protein [Mycena indigotica]|uniref:Mechanosensitive ion channel protein n=1 Tax=Mycena indigotica TaxID=2126181 RepID=A0A8H6WFB6_9AGAR|nr:Mechanosensitive ion channel protein [Mycena indigotica]KAF7315647.1 Mechanosensitive ion channel protein [Mycena indigotica]
MSGQQGYDPVELHPAPAHPYPPSNHEWNDSMSIPLNNMGPSSSRRPGLPNMPQPYDAERGGGGVNTPSRNSSWDVLRKVENSYQQFDPAAGSDSHLASRLYHYLLNASIVTRWILFIFPLLGIIWIPGILDYTGTTNKTVWGVRFRWWSIFLTVLWGGWWGCLAIAMIFPRIIRRTLGVIAVGTRRYLDWLQVLHRYVALFAWTLTVFVSYNPLINSQQGSDATKSAIQIIDLGQKLFFAFFLCAALLLAEKFAIQFIAGKFHERSYAERIADQAFAVKSVVTLYTHSKNVGRPDALRADTAKDMLNPSKILKKALKGVRTAAKTTTTAFGNVASEITGTSVLQPNSPQAIVQTALESANRSRLLARRLFYSFAKPDANYLLVEDITRFFRSQDEADKVFALFDRDSNGDASLDEVEMAVMEFHREQLSIEHSMQDLDSAVGRLDNIFMSLYAIIAILIIAVALEAQVATLVTSAGTLVLGLSWLIGGTLAEVLTSIIFLFIKHPFDVGDRVIVSGSSYTVKEVKLSIVWNSSGFSFHQDPTFEHNIHQLRWDFGPGAEHGSQWTGAKLLQFPLRMAVLNFAKFIQNIRRSPQLSETFTFDVNYSTSFEDVEKLRERMLAFVTAERRDYQPAFDVVVVDFPEQAKMTLSADIKYKGNGQQGALKAKRRNKWVCQLKAALAECGIYGPSGNPNSEPGTQRYTEVPWHEFKSELEKAKNTHPEGSAVPEGGWRLSGQNAVLLDSSQDIFSDPDDLHRATPRPQGSSGISMPTAATVAQIPR